MSLNAPLAAGAAGRMAEEILGEVGEKLSTFGTGIEKLNVFAEKIGGPGDNATLRKKVAAEKANCTDLKDKIGQLLKNPDVKAAVGDSSDIKADWRDKSKVYNKHSTALQKVMKKLGELEKEHPASGKSRGAGDDDDDGPRGDVEEGGHQEQAMFNKRALKAVNVDMMKHDEAIQAEKAEEIREIEEGVNEIAGCYEELHNLVDQQQEGIDTAEENIIQTRENVQKGTVEIKKAREYQKSSRKKMICIIVLAVVILGVGLGVGFAAS